MQQDSSYTLPTQGAIQLILAGISNILAWLTLDDIAKWVSIVVGLVTAASVLHTKYTEYSRRRRRSRRPPPKGKP